MSVLLTGNTDLNPGGAENFHPCILNIWGALKSGYFGVNSEQWQPYG